MHQKLQFGMKRTKKNLNQSKISLISWENDWLRTKEMKIERKKN